MKTISSIPKKIYQLPDLLYEVKRWRLKSQRIVFTNGVFDILHEGHIASLSDAAANGNILIVALNTDASVKRLKGESRPVNNENSRALIMASLVMVDAVLLFDEDTPLELIRAILPDVLVKGGDYTPETVVGAKEVIAAGGELKIVPIKEGFSTTGIIERMKGMG
ncbi:MAG: D-glycero-beta-D-manno-heptose 1-phosphate adenylyltransferase [Ferruginibacter sp.]